MRVSAAAALCGLLAVTACGGGSGNPPTAETASPAAVASSAADIEQAPWNPEANSLFRAYLDAEATAYDEIPAFAGGILSIRETEIRTMQTAFDAIGDRIFKL